MSERKTPWLPGPYTLDYEHGTISDRSGVIAFLRGALNNDTTGKATGEVLAAAPEMAELLAVFVAAWKRHEEPIGESDLYDEQPYHITVTLGDLRKARALLARIGAP